MLFKFGHEIGSSDPARESGYILDEVGRPDLATQAALFKEYVAESLTHALDRREEAGRTSSNDCTVM